jgi:hypothetical protein
VCKNSWASGTSGVTLCRVQKLLAAMSPGMNTDPRLPLCKLYPAIVCKPPRRDHSHAAVTLLVSISAPPTRPHVPTWRVVESRHRRPGITVQKAKIALGKLFTGHLGQGQ